MQKTCPSLKLAGLTPSAGLTLKQKALSGPRISSTEPTLDLFSRQTPLLNLGNLVISVHLTTKVFSDLWRNVPQGTTQEGGPWSKPPRLLLNPPLPLGAPRPPNEPRWKLPPRASQNCLPILKIIIQQSPIHNNYPTHTQKTHKKSTDRNNPKNMGIALIISFINSYYFQDMEREVEKEKEVKEEKKEEKVEQKGENQEDPDKKDPETLSEGERMGLSKQQLRKLEKRLATKKKKEQALAKEEEVKRVAANRQNQQNRKPRKEEVEIDEQHKKIFKAQKIVNQANTKLPGENEDNILITSALPYVNNVPHLGNIIGCVLSADVFSRFKKLQGSNVLYICGTDQYGTATEVKAREEKKTPKEICDHYFQIHSDVYKWFDIGFDYFGRTSTEWHSKITQEIFLDIHNEKMTTQEEMMQCYCPHCDFWLADRFIVGTCPFCQFQDARGDQCDKCQKTFYSPTELVDYFCLICKNTPEVKPTVHFFINLPEIQHQLEKWIDSASKKGEWSENSITITKAWTNMGLKPKCITRDLKWGVTVPVEEFKKKVFYVWFDAPIGYISITANLLQQNYKNWWINNDVKLFQFMGKDNVPFHTVIFPSSLIASRQGWTLLHHISTTEYLNYQSGKFSKRNGTGVFGTHAIELENEIPSEVWRYYLLVNRPEKSDSQFSWKDFVDKNNNELLANLGNLVHRALQFIYANENKVIPSFDAALWTEADEEFVAEIESRYIKYRDLLNKVEIKEGLKFSMEVSSRGNKYLQDSKFWEKEHQKSGRTKLVLNVIANFIRFESFLVEPYMPSTSAKINFLLGLEDRSPYDQQLGKALNEGVFKQVFLGLTSKSKGIKQPVPLFTTFTEQQASVWREKFRGKQKTQ